MRWRTLRNTRRERKWWGGVEGADSAKWRLGWRLQGDAAKARKKKMKWSEEEDGMNIGE